MCGYVAFLEKMTNGSPFPYVAKGWLIWMTRVPFVFNERLVTTSTNKIVPGINTFLKKKIFCYFFFNFCFSVYLLHYLGRQWKYFCMIIPWIMVITRLSVSFLAQYNSFQLYGANNMWTSHFSSITSPSFFLVWLLSWFSTAFFPSYYFNATFLSCLPHS